MYKDSHDTMTVCNEHLREVEHEIDDARQALLNAFNAWYIESFNEKPTFTSSAAAVSVLPHAEMTDTLDDDEQFEQLQMAKVLETEPESLAFVRARKAVSRKNGARR